MKKIIFLIGFIFYFLISHAQFGVSVGLSMIKSFGIIGVYPGFHISGEYGKDDESTLFGRISFFPGKKGEKEVGIVSTQAKDLNVIPYQYSVESQEKFNYTTIELGKRYYFGNGYDNGFGFFGGSNICLIFNKVKFEVEDYDEATYDLMFLNEKVSNRSKAFGTLFGVSFGLNAGIKHSFNFGTLFLDGGLNYALFAQPSNDIAALSGMYRSLFFNFNLGIRKEFY